MSSSCGGRGGRGEVVILLRRSHMMEIQIGSKSKSVVRIMEGGSRACGHGYTRTQQTNANAKWILMDDDKRKTGVYKRTWRPSKQRAVGRRSVEEEGGSVVRSPEGCASCCTLKRSRVGVITSRQTAVVQPHGGRFRSNQSRNVR